MRLTGTLRSWNDDRGFGFIAPSHGGAELFVHISALPKDGSRPTVGEILTYELGRGRNGQPQAVRVLRQAIGTPANRPRAVRHSTAAGRAILPRAIGLALVVAVGAFGYNRFERQPLNYAAPQHATGVHLERNLAGNAQVQAFNCDGRTHCSQMTSCAEAKYFLKNCPGAKMDGNHDGVPCEQQWCTSLFAK